MSFAQILDPISGRTFNGGLFPYPDWDGNLRETLINNFDVRWEMYGGRAQMVSLSAFYKTFDDPIELVRIQAAPTAIEYQPRNVGDGSILFVVADGESAPVEDGDEGEAVDARKASS